MFIVNSLIGVADLHCGCRLGLCPPKGAKLRLGGTYKPSKFQKGLGRYWKEFWEKWVPMAVRRDDYGVVVNGDLIEGRHHGATTPWSNDIADQADAAYELLAPIVDMCDGRFWVIGGTEAHGGAFVENEERLAQRLGAVPDPEGICARPELWKYVGQKKEILTHWLHHIGVTGSSAYETTAPHKEFIQACEEAGKWGRRPPDIVIRAHRHRFVKTEVATDNERGVAIVLPSWQGKTYYTYRVAGARQSQPQFGGIMIRLSEEGEPYTRQKIFSLKRPEAE